MLVTATCFSESFMYILYRARQFMEFSVEDCHKETYGCVDADISFHALQCCLFELYPTFWLKSHLA